MSSESVAASLSPDLLAPCGIVCARCKFLGKPCLGCHRQEGKPFHGGICDVYACVASQGLEHCGECASFPCKRIVGFATDPDHGFDNRLEYLYRRRQVGTDQFLRELPMYGGDSR
jgi:hypothetical protein